MRGNGARKLLFLFRISTLLEMKNFSGREEERDARRCKQEEILPTWLKFQLVQLSDQKGTSNWVLLIFPSHWPDFTILLAVVNPNFFLNRLKGRIGQSGGRQTDTDMPADQTRASPALKTAHLKWGSVSGRGHLWHVWQEEQRGPRPEGRIYAIFVPHLWSPFLLENGEGPACGAECELWSERVSIRENKEELLKQIMSEPEPNAGRHQNALVFRHGARLQFRANGYRYDQILCSL